MSQPRTLSREDNLFISSAQAAMLDEPLPKTVWVLYLLAIVLVAGITWSSLATVDEVTRSDARIVPDGKEQIVTSLESGVLSKLLVREGEEVEAGQPLAELDPTRAEAAQNESQVKRLGLMAQVTRLRAEALGQPLKFPAEVQQVQRLVDSESEVFDTRRRVLEEAVSSYNRSIGLLASELKMAQDMSAKGLMSNVEVMRLNRQVNELQQQRNERISRFRQEASSDLSRVQTELAQIDEQMVVRRDALQHTVLKSPVKGFVKNIKMNTVGSAVSSGAAIMEIVPMGARVLVEARIKPKDIGFLQVGQSAVVKVNGYDFNVNGGMHGKIEYISPDALGETEKNGEGTYYRVIVAAERVDIKLHGEPLPVIPGMTASLEIRTGERSVLSYLLRPMLKSREALRER